MVIAGDGLALTNSHVGGGTTRVRLSFANGSGREARVPGDQAPSQTRPDTGLALLCTDLPAGCLATKLSQMSGRALKRGQLVAAIGNPPGFDPSAARPGLHLTGPNPE